MERIIVGSRNRGHWIPRLSIGCRTSCGNLGPANTGSDNVAVLLNQCVGDNVLLGDANQDGMVSLLNVQPFVELLIAGEFQVEADINGDGAVTLLDVDPFVALLAGG